MARNKPSKKQRKRRALAYMTRGQATTKLQLSLKDFRRLSILKGIYPVEPKNKKVNPTSQAKTYYLRKDIKYLSHDPIIWKFWDFKIFMKRMAKAKGRKDNETVKRIRENKPFYKLDNIVKERYPTFIDALRDLDDALSMCFLYAMFGKSKALPLEMIELSRRLTLEFMYYVMETKSLRKVFISIKGYYYEANIMGQNVRWVVPHHFVLTRVPDVDFQVMKTFTEFYITLLGFVNYKLYTSNSFYYPPKFNETKNSLDETDEDEFSSDDVVAALNRPLLGRNSTIVDENHMIDDFEGEDNQEEAVFGSSVLTFHQLQKLQNLFKGLKFFLNREVPRESLCFAIRSFSGEVSWDKQLFPGATFDEDDERITHQIVDRPDVQKRYMNRHYIQPQWIFDSINARRLLPVQNYFIGTQLPAHLSPFVEEKPGDYVPPEKLSLLGLHNSNQDDQDDETNEESEHEEETVQLTEPVQPSQPKPTGQMAVKKGKVAKVDKVRLEEQKQNEEKRLQMMAMTKKKKKLYTQIVRSNKHKNRETEKLKRKREEYERGEKKNKRSN